MPGVVYAPESDLRRYVDAGMLLTETLGQAFSASFLRHSSRIALRGLEVEYTYGELHDITCRLAGAFLRLGLKPLDRVIFQISNSCELIFSFIACIKAGLIPVCTLHAHRELEIGYLARKSEARMHFVQGDDPHFDDVAFALQMQASAPSLQWVVQARGESRQGVTHLRDLMSSISLEEARRLLSRLELDPFQVTVFQLSGGTTGVPKIIPRFHNEYAYSMRAVAAFNDYRMDDCLFMPMPMMHNLNMSCCFGPMLLSGGAVIVSTSLAHTALTESIRRFAPTWAFVVGPLVEKLRPAIESGELDVSTLRGVFSPNNAPALRKLFKAPVLHIFGMTEGTLMFNQPENPPQVLDTMVGRPVSALDVVKIFEVGTEEEILEAGVEGECAFSGPYTIHGYYDSPERDAEAFTSDGMYRSGDLMSFHDVGGMRYYEFRGRTKDVVSRAGEKINAAEVEDVIHRHHSVNQCVVVGMPDPVYEERVCVFLVLKANEEPLTLATLGIFLKHEGLAKFKWPERIEVVDDIPLTKSGKPDKLALKRLVAYKLAPNLSDLNTRPKD